MNNYRFKFKSFCIIFLFLGMFVSAAAQEYWIEGFYERHKDGYTLTDVHTQGITIDGKTDLSDTIYSGAKVTVPNCRNGLPANMIKFSFEKVKIGCKTWRDLHFEYWDDDNERDSIKWKEDVEACMGESRGFNQKDMVMMLVLDYSSSMDNSEKLKKDKKNSIPNIDKMKNMAVEFINSMSMMSSGNLHVGIIAFAGMDRATSQIFPITPLTKDNKGKFQEFIRKSSMGTETALYYSLDNAMKQIEDYCMRQNFDTSKFNGTCMVTLTDGLDNASINDDISITMRRGSKNEYLAYLEKNLKNTAACKKIMGMPLEHFAVGFTGSEDFTEDDKVLFENVLKRITQDNSHFKLANNFDEVEAYFKYIISQLTERWQTLNVFVGEAQHGRVRWVLECEPEQVKIEKPKPAFMRLPLLGLNVGMGGGFSAPTKFLEFSVGLDLAVAFTPKFAMGLYGSFKTSFKTIHQYALGLDFMIGPQQKAFLLGLGINRRLRDGVIYFEDSGYWVKRYPENDVDFDMRLGGVFKAFYFFVDFSIGRYYWYDRIYYSAEDFVNDHLLAEYNGNRLLPQVTLNFGINFMQLGKKNKNNEKK